MQQIIQQIDRKALISIFIVAYIYTVHGFYLCPPLPWQYRVFGTAQQIANTVGLGGASFALFAPNVGDSNKWLYALVWDDSGTTINYRYPSIEQWSLLDRIFMDRFRKYSEIFRLGHSIPIGKLNIWIDLARYTARLLNSPNFHPSVVYISRHVEPIPLPTTINGEKRRAPEDEIIFNYSVDPQDLQ